MDEQGELPAWLERLVSDVWGAPEWNTWRTVASRLAEHGVTLVPYGPCDRPTIIEAGRVEYGWLSETVRWDEDGERSALILAIERLALALDEEATPSPSG